ncbi:hypothetical protein BT93_L0992 [Corymbia citriodora subsp. variegata]|uniref:Rhodanese domain-containing protein n=1 Tax=Corymbia citriodora subsp. variegata TaxID=360336 RepID=A0A8T0CED7_CORYI|nr:hypothetical protein BT93_L0992 [Corymbia citriodora subsp. variegata]
MALARPVALAAIRTNVCRQCQQLLRPQNFSAPALRSSQPSVHRGIRPSFTPVRWHSAPASKSKVYDFQQVKQISEKPSAERVLIDVREPSEYEAGFIPGAINLPIKSQPDALFLPAHEFEDRFGMSKPSADQEVVFYCKSGVRSSAAASLAQQVGYQNVAEYRGSWLDWEKNGGPSGK